MLLLLLSGCANGTPAWMNNSWYSHGNASGDDTQIPKGPLTVPKAAPVPPVEKQPLPVQTSPAPQAQLQTPVPTKSKVALLLPLSGKNAPLGQAMLNAAQQAVFDIAPPNFELMPRDTGGTDEQVDLSARDALASGAQLIIGPLFASHIPIVRNVAQANNVCMLTLSTDTSQAAPCVYVMGFAPDAQVERVVRFAVAHGMRRIAALVPNNAYGERVGQALRAAVDRSGGSLVTVDVYDADKHDTDVYVHDLFSRREAIDALFLPEGGVELKAITNQLTAAGFDLHTTHLLGTGLWDVADMAQQDTAVVGGIYAASDPALRRRFNDTYKSTFGQEPPRLVTLAYDATALAAVLAKRGTGYDQGMLTNPNGFAGLDGLFRLTPQGIAERGLAILQITSDGARVVDPAPTTFAVSP
jgi:ABC-type branched-subunit amino acid transport system substrate-binding protein